MADLKTQATDQPVAEYLAAVTPERRRAEAVELDALFRAATGFAPRVWSGGMLGYGRYDYRYASGRSGSWFATGFAPRKAALTLYILPGYADHGEILAALGPHRAGKGCVYITALDRIDRAVLPRLIRAGLADLARHWPVLPE
ncbi:DUF1801 domain-containing protein [Roseivivax sp. CAU 1761]